MLSFDPVNHLWESVYYHLLTINYPFMTPQLCAGEGPLIGPLSEQEMKLYQVLEPFFSDSSWSEIEALFDKILETCLTADDGPFTKGDARSNLWIMRKRILEVLMACWDFTIICKNGNG